MANDILRKERAWTAFYLPCERWYYSNPDIIIVSWLYTVYFYFYETWNLLNQLKSLDYSNFFLPKRNWFDDGVQIQYIIACKSCYTNHNCYIMCKNIIKAIWKKLVRKVSLFNMYLYAIRIIIIYLI